MPNFDPALVIHLRDNFRDVGGHLCRGWQLFWQRGVIHSLGRVIALSVTHIFGQTFIAKRSVACGGGCTSAFSGDACWRWRLRSRWCSAGSIQQHSRRSDDVRDVSSSVFPSGDVSSQTPPRALLFHGLDISAVLVLTGIGVVAVAAACATRERQRAELRNGLLPADPALRDLRDGARAHRLADMAARARPTASSRSSTRSRSSPDCCILPFGKFFHIFQRPAQLGVKLYHEAGAMSDSGRTAPAAASASPRACMLTI